MKTLIIYRIVFGIFTGLSVCLPLTVNAAFITDNIVVEVRTERFGQGAILKELASGTSVEVLMSDGKYTRVRTTDNITGWIDSKFLTNEKPNQLEYLELLSKVNATEEKLRAAEEKLANSSGNASSEDIETLKKQAKDARWMKAEMQKARDRAEKAEGKLKAELKKQSKKSTQNDDAKQQLEDLRIQNNKLETRLAAALLVNEQQSETASIEPVPAAFVATPATEKTDEGWTVSIQWFFGSLFVALIIGFITGFTWLDKRIRQRHGGFRIY